MDLGMDDPVILKNGEIKRWANVESRIACGDIPENEPVAIEESLRIKVDSELQANHVVEYAEERGFCVAVSWNNPPYDYRIIEFDCRNGEQGYSITNDKNPDLTISDYEQWTGWISFHAEDDECDTCGGSGAYETEAETPCPGVTLTVEHDCPDCSDESEDYDEPRPEDKEWWDRFMESSLASSNQRNELGIYDYQPILTILKDRIDDLEAELQDVREELFHKENYIQRLRERLNNSRNALRNNQERLEEARDYMTREHPEDGTFDVVLQILSPDSDEGDGECE